MRSRLSRRLEKQSQKTLIFSLVGSLVVIVLLVKFGIPLLANMSLFLSGVGNTPVEEKKASAFVSPPMLDIPFTATNSAEIKVAGTALGAYEVKLYVNDVVFGTKKVDDNSFEFEDVELDKGDNILQAKSITKDKEESKLSDEIVVIYKDKEPSLSIDSPSNGQTFSKDDTRTNVSGKTDPGVKITINGYWAIVQNDGKFSYSLSLKPGENIIKVTAEDEAGNKKEEERKVTLSQ